MTNQDIKVFENSVLVGRFAYDKPTLKPDKASEIVLVQKNCFGPLECWTWSMDEQGRFWEEYKWCENDLYEADNYKKEVSQDEMVKKMQEMQKFFDGYGLDEYVTAYVNAEQFVKNFSD